MGEYLNQRFLHFCDKFEILDVFTLDQGGLWILIYADVCFFLIGHLLVLHRLGWLNRPTLGWPIGVHLPLSLSFPLPWTFSLSSLMPLSLPIPLPPHLPCLFRALFHCSIQIKSFLYYPPFLYFHQYLEMISSCFHTIIDTFMFMNTRGFQSLVHYTTTWVNDQIWSSSYLTKSNSIKKTKINYTEKYTFKKWLNYSTETTCWFFGVFW